LTDRRDGRRGDQPHGDDRSARAAAGESRAAPAGPRLFVGVPLPDEAIAAVSAAVDEVRAMPLPNGARDVRWVRLDGLHLTLRFLGPTPEPRIAPTVAAVEAIAGSASGPFDIELAGAGTFPPGRRPRTLWIGLTEGVDALSRLATVTETALVEAGWEADGRPFKAHLTLARSDGVAVGALVADRLRNAMADRHIRCTIDRLGLFESVTGGGPARYVPVTLLDLGSSSDPGRPVYHLQAPGPS
jgi:RNA 2',3'-cyclic 3'-phosphodiesterase